jgi:Domain of unknown function (DUF4145)
MAERTSKRSQLLLEVLRHINDGNYDVHEELLSFGARHADSQNPADSDEIVFQKMRRLIYDYVARSAALERTSLSGPPSLDSIRTEFKQLMDQLKPETRETLDEAMREMGAGGMTPALPGGSQVDSLDRYYSEEILNKLDAVVSRAVSLERVGLKIVPNKQVQLSFEEAHRCYLYGFHLACAVFCRAIVEGALREAVQADKELRTIYALVEVARKKGALTGDRPKCARDVDKAGNLAIHEPDKFDKYYSAEKVEGILVNTRKVLEELYRVPP